MVEEIQKINKLVAIYGRVSTSNQENEGTIESQLLAVREFAKKNGYIVVREYLDEGWSGDTLVRPALDQLRMEAKQKIWEGVVIYDPDRLARRYSYQELVMDELREAGIEVIFITTPAPKNPEEKVMYGMRGIFSEWERMKITERFRLGKVRKVKEGHLLVSEPLYGYSYILKDGDKDGYYEVNPKESKVVKMIFAWVGDEGLTLRKVVRRLQELGIKPRKSKRGVWNTSTLSTLFRNRAYIGEARWGSSYAVVPVNPYNKEKYRKLKKSSRRNKPEEEWIASKIPVPVIIDRELFYKTRKRLEKNFELSKRNTKNEYLLGGKIYCLCGRRRTGEGALHGKHLYYRCTDRILRHPLPRVCNEHGVNARLADKLVWDGIAKLITSKELLKVQANRWLEKRKNKTKLNQGDLGAMLKELDKLKEQEDRYNKAYGAGVFTMEKLKEYTVPIAEKINSLESQVAKYKQEQDKVVTMLPDDSEIEAFTEEAKKDIKTYDFAKKRELIIKSINKIIGVKTELKVAGCIPIYAQNVAFNSIHRNSWFAKCW
ncbi:recombinase family protein [Patescibacteria group bacterium]|nr:recombinase family protein [Patescibacteria group bacterium]MBU4367645.1 recombinase family protein [Patescibacteria group bacterium]MBU4462125.1 recombinase family protein [Patescibacteria group bacterium]MCG2700444.1 recombinase family protein [Candidatus Parcubacteria bacterium]